jgi:hypothetical protein
MEPPIVFIHKGNNDYLKYTVQCAKASNPKKDVLFLGDETNNYLTKFGAKHFLFSDYNDGEEIKLFRNVFKVIAGSKHGKEEWLRFVFQRWYHIYNFILYHKIDRFWTFDSDTLILRDLAYWEESLKDYDCTEQCDGICMNGLVNSRRVVEGYVNKMNELFQRADYLEQQRAEFLLNPYFAFTEMRAYDVYKKEANLKTIHLANILNEETFDDCICVSHGMETYPYKLYGHTLKTMYWKSNGELFFARKEDKKLIKVNTLNMSWVPIYLYPRVLQIAYKENITWRTGSLPLIRKMSIAPSLLYRIRVSWNVLKSKLFSLSKGFFTR